MVGDDGQNIPGPEGRDSRSPHKPMLFRESVENQGGILQNQAVAFQALISVHPSITGKGLADLIRERFGLKVTFYFMAALFLTNIIFQ